MKFVLAQTSLNKVAIKKKLEAIGKKLPLV